MANDYQEHRKEREARIDRARRKRFFQRFVLWVVIVVVVGGFLVWLVWVAKHRGSSANLPGTLYPVVGREHIALNDAPSVPYNSNPPSSGAHFGSPAHWGVYDYEVNDKIFIHNLEHGGVWIAYHASTTPGAVVDQLKALVGEFGGSKIVMAPRSANDADIAIVAWTRVLKFNLAVLQIPNSLTPAAKVLSENQKNQIREFYRAYRNHGPEFVPDSMPGVDPKSVQ